MADIIFAQLIEPWRQFDAWPPELHSAPLRRRDPLPLSRLDLPPLHVRDEREYLKDDVRDEHGEKPMRDGGVEKRHVQDPHVDHLPFGKNLPLRDDLLVVSPETVDAFHHQYVVGTKTLQKATPSRPVEILPAPLVGEDVLRRYACGLEGRYLPVEILLAG